MATIALTSVVKSEGTGECVAQVPTQPRFLVSHNQSAVGRSFSPAVPQPFFPAQFTPFGYVCEGWGGWGGGRGGWGWTVRSVGAAVCVHACVHVYCMWLCACVLYVMVLCRVVGKYVWIIH